MADGNTWRRWGAYLVMIVALVASVSGLAAPQDRRLVIAHEERRLALVVGNDGYADAPLRNARNDARTIARTLEDVGFRVTLLQDATRQAVTSAIATFGDGLRAGDVALFYFAGHGVQVDAENYLIPVDFRGASATDVRLNAVRVSEIQQLLQAARVSMLVLDACRNNPFAGTRGSSGLGAMEARGSLIAFATGSGQTAADGDDANGLFTRELVRALAQPGLSAQEVFGRVRRGVYDASGGRQFPALYDGLLGEFVFRPTVAAPVTSTAPPSAPPVSAATDSDLALRAELAVWEAIKDTRSAAGFEDYLRQYPSGRFKAAAESRLADLRNAMSAAVATNASGRSGGATTGNVPGATVIPSASGMPRTAALPPNSVALPGSGCDIGIISCVYVTARDGTLQFNDSRFGQVSCKGLSVSKSKARAVDALGHEIPGTSKVTVKGDFGSRVFYTFDDKGQVEQFYSQLQSICGPLDGAGGTRTPARR